MKLTILAGLDFVGRTFRVDKSACHIEILKLTFSPLHNFTPKSVIAQQFFAWIATEKHVLVG
jgi:hypothetical protein